MTKAAKVSFANTVEMGPSGGALVAVAELLTIEPPQLSRDTIDVTTHDSTGGAMEFIGEPIYDPGEMKLQMHYISGSAFDLASLTAFTTAAPQDVKMKVKGTGTTSRMLTFSGVVTEYALDSYEVKGKQSASMTLKVSGPITQAAYV